MSRRQPWAAWFALLFPLFVASVFALSSCSSAESASENRSLDRVTYADKLHGAWQATMVANHSGIDLQGIWLDEAGPGETVPLVLLDEWSTDDDTHVEWLDLHLLETHGLDPTDEQIRDEWVDHLNNDIWVSALRARQLMDEGWLPPDTGRADLNPEGVWSIGAQLQTEVFGLISPGLPDAARSRAQRFARVTNSGLAVDVSAFYAHLYAEAFVEDDMDLLLDGAVNREPAGSEVAEMVTRIRGWHRANPDDWRATRREIRDAYDTDPEWWASRVNFAATVMALLYGDGDLLETLHLAGLAGWDADNNMTTAVGLLGIISGFDELPEPIRSSTDIYFNQDLTGDLPQYDSVTNIAARTQRLGESVIFEAGGQVEDGVYRIPIG